MKAHDYFKYSLPVTLLSATICIIMGTYGAGVAEAEGEPSQVSVASNGQAIVRGAEVVSIVDNVITAKTSWGNAEVLWHVYVSGTTQVIPDAVSSQILTEIKPGHTISFSGHLDTGHTGMVVRASVLKDTFLMRDMSGVSAVVASVDTATGTLVVKADNNEYTVSTGRGTLVARGGNSTRLSRIDVGDEIAISGTLNMISNSLNASRIDITTKQEGVASENPIVDLLQWMQGSRRVLSAL